jgi:lycopene cyclase domain-containing protein
LTYFGVLATFILLPLIVLLIWVPRDIWRWLFRREGQVDWTPYLIILAHVAMALIYTTPWDNYLVATGVWWYDPALVTGFRIGYVPIEEYTFFILQTLLTGLWTLALIRIMAKNPAQVHQSLPIRLGIGSILGMIWLVSTVLLFSDWRSVNYLVLILSWALLPVLIQVFFGADILLANWRVLLPAVLAPTLYLWLVDSLSISSGTWTIDPSQTTGLMLGPLPFEEMLFFFMTNLIIGCGVTLMLSPDSQLRAWQWLHTWRRRFRSGEG